MHMVCCCAEALVSPHTLLLSHSALAPLNPPPPISSPAVFLPEPSDVARAVEHFAQSPRLLVAHPLRPMKPKPHGWVER